MWSIFWDGKYKSGFRGSKQISNSAELFEILCTRDPDGDAEFVLQNDKTTHENLTISVTDNRWFLYFFPEDNTKCGFQSLGNNTDNYATTTMPAGSNIDVMNYTLVTEEQAFKAAETYMQTGNMPTCINWEEL